jgi:protein-disulfide isomerase
MQIRRFLALLLLLALLLAACSGNDENKNDNNNDDTGAQTEAVNDTTVANSGGSANVDTDVPAADLGDDAKTYLWADYGVSIKMPADWGTALGGSDFDLSVASPAAMAGGDGPFMTFRVYTSLGAGSLEEAMQPVVDDTGADLVSFGGDSLGVTVADETGVQNLVLYPYRDQGAAMFVQSSGKTTEDNALLKGILENITITPPAVDIAAADAAFQASLEADGTLTYGDADAPVVMREYLSFTCGHCANYTLSMENLVALDVEAGRVRLELAPLAGDEKAALATHATYCAAEQGKGFSAYEALYQDYLSNGYEAAYTAASVNAIMTSLDLDLDTLNACINDAKYAPSVDQIRVSFTDMGLTGTPTVVVAAPGGDPAPLLFPDGQVWSGTIPLSALRSVINLMVTQNLAPQAATDLFFAE